MSKSSRTKSLNSFTVPPSHPLAASRTTPSTFFSLPLILLFTMLLIVALRLTLNETPVEAFSQLIESVAPSTDAAPQTPEPGPAAIVGFSLLTMLLTGLATCCTRLTRQAWLLLALIVAILALATASTFHAANHFVALVGTFDMAMTMLGGWTIMLLASNEARRRFVVAALLAVLAVWITKGLYQRFVDFPDTISYYNGHKQEIWQQHGWAPGDFHIKLFEGRMNSKEVTGFSSFSNVTAQGLIALPLLALALIIAAARDKTTWVNQKIPVTMLCIISVDILEFSYILIIIHAILFLAILIIASRKKAPWITQEFPITLLFAMCLALLLGLSCKVLLLTESKGGCAAFVLFALLLGAGLLYRNILIRHWRLTALIVLAAWIVGTIGVIAYGRHFDTLPTRSLMFRWHYWTASEPIVRSSPLLGVGLNNYGEYYLQYKRPTSPEDVKDPHSFFVRIASELGIPATVLMVVLLIKWFYYCARSLTQNSSPGIAIPGLNPEQPNLAFSLLAAAIFCALWWITRMILNERLDMALSLILNLIYASVAFGGFMLADATCRHAPGAQRAAAFALLLGAVGMLLYDQVNTGLVTGPLALFFWACLGLVSASSQSEKSKPIDQISGACLIITSIALVILVWIPLLQDNLPWDPHPFERSYILELAQRDPKLDQKELQLLDSAIKRDPRAIELLNHRIRLKVHLGQSVQQDIRNIIALDCCDVQLRIALAKLPSDWPAAQRIAALRQAQWLNKQLEPQEPKRLSEKELQEIDALIASFQAKKQIFP